MRIHDIPIKACETCPYCDRKFPNQEILVHHKGRTHADDISEREQDSVRDALEQETTQLRMYQLQALILLILLYFGFLLVYAVVT